MIYKCILVKPSTHIQYKGKGITPKLKNHSYVSTISGHLKNILPTVEITSAPLNNRLLIQTGKAFIIAEFLLAFRHQAATN